ECETVARKRYLLWMPLANPFHASRPNCPCVCVKLLPAPADGWMECRTRPASVFPEPAAHQEPVMFAIIGIVVVFGAVVGGYLMEHGNLKVLLQPAELLIIGGAGAGTVLIANPLHILKQIAAGIGVVFKGSKFTKQRYMESLKIAYELLNKARRQGLMSLESDVETSEQSPIFSKDPEFLKDHHVRHFFCDSMRMAISGM